MGVSNQELNPPGVRVHRFQNHSHQMYKTRHQAHFKRRKEGIHRLSCTTKIRMDSIKLRSENGPKDSTKTQTYLLLDDKY